MESCGHIIFFMVEFPPHLGGNRWEACGIRYPKNGGSLYFNYKAFHSIILFALMDANYKLMWVDVGVNGSSFDGQIFNHSQMKSGIINVPCRSLQVNHLPVMTVQYHTFLLGTMPFHFAHGS